MRAIFDALRGEAVIGSLRVRIVDAGSHGELQIGGEDGMVLRPVSFGQRTRVVTRAALAANPMDTVAAGILQAAMVQPGAGEAQLLEVIALALAGADQPAPPFAETALLLARSAGWHYAEIADADAAEIDRMARVLEQQPHDGWTRLLFAASATADELAAIRAEYAENLLRRVDGGQTVPAAPDATTADLDWTPERTHRATFSLPEVGGDTLGAQSPAALDDQEDAAGPGVDPGAPAAPARGAALTFRGQLPRSEKASGSPPLPGAYRGADDPATPWPGREPRPGSPATPASFTFRPAPPSPQGGSHPGTPVLGPTSPRGTSQQRLAQPAPQARSATQAKGSAADARRGLPAVHEADARRRLPAVREAAAAFSATAAFSTETIAEELIVPVPEPARQTIAMPSLADAGEIADLLAILLAEEADLRGLDR